MFVKAGLKNIRKKKLIKINSLDLHPSAAMEIIIIQTKPITQLKTATITGVIYCLYTPTKYFANSESRPRVLDLNK